MSQFNDSPPVHVRTRGFTLIEVMITVALLAVLAAIALPSYLDSIRKGRRADAVAALSAVQQAQERWRSNRSAYTTALTAKPGDNPAGLGLSDTSAKEYYAIAIDAADETSFRTTATAKAGTSQAKDGNCVRLRIRVDGGEIFYGSASAEGDFDESPSNPCWAR